MALTTGSAAAGTRWPPPRSAYIHVPFCRHRCGYCNFSVVAGRDDLIERFLSALDAELEPLGRPPADTLYIGGGTPTHLDLDQLDRLLSIIDDRFDFQIDGEWSVEANPEDITPEKLQRLAEAGVNRISLGVQSFHDRKLQVLERGHRGEAVQQTVMATAEVIPNVSIDLIFAAPDETLDDWQRDLQAALSLPIQHLSTYALTYEKGTSYWSRRNRGELQSLSDSLELEMYQLARSLTAQGGLSQYEISNFARSDYRSRHNLAYWQGSGWFGAGPGAARFVDGARQLNHRSTTTYLKRVESGQDPTFETETLSPEEYARERIAFGLRMIDGVDLDQIGDAAGVDLIALCGPVIDQLTSEGLLLRQRTHLRLTEDGIRLADTVASRVLFPEN